MTETTVTTSQDLKRKMPLKGKVIKTTLAGAIVHLGLDKPGIIHIANLSDKQINRVDDVVKEGQEVDVWVRRLNKDAKYVDLTMIEPLALDWRDIKKEMVLKGQVVRLEKFGAFIEVGAERPGLAHISELTHDFIRQTEDAVKIGDEVEAKVIDFNRRKKQIKLSLKAMQDPPMKMIEAVQQEEDENAAPVLTAMEMAYRRAMDSNSPEMEGAEGSDQKSKTREERENILSRTLDNRR